MKRILFLLLLIIPFFGFGQDIGGTGWKITFEDNDKMIFLFEDDLSFHYMYKDNGTIWCDSDIINTWSLEGDKVVISINDGYLILSGIISNSGDFMSGMSMNKLGNTRIWSGEIINF